MKYLELKGQFKDFVFVEGHQKEGTVGANARKLN
jgi:hypothetical protein